MTTRILVTYYSATGSVHRLAEAVHDGAESAGADIRLRRIAELAPAEASSVISRDAVAGCRLARRAISDTPSAVSSGVNASNMRTIRDKTDSPVLA